MSNTKEETVTFTRLLCSDQEDPWDGNKPTWSDNVEEFDGLYYWVSEHKVLDRPEAPNTGKGWLPPRIGGYQPLGLRLSEPPPPPKGKSGVSAPPQPVTAKEVEEIFGELYQDGRIPLSVLDEHLEMAKARLSGEGEG